MSSRCFRQSIVCKWQHHKDRFWGGTTARHGIKETTATNGAEGNVSNKTQVTLKLLEEGGLQLTTIISKIMNCAHNPTTLVKNLHAFSHFKHETLTALQYSQDFGIITKESSKWVTKWATKYFTHEKSYYRVPHTSTEFANVNFMRPLPSEEINPDTENAIKRICGE